MEACNIVVEGIHVATYYRSLLLHISEMFAKFEMFQTIVNNILFSSCSLFTVKRKEKQKNSQAFSRFPKLKLCCVVHCYVITVEINVFFSLGY